MKLFITLAIILSLGASLGMSAEIEVEGGVLNALNAAVTNANSGDVLLLAAGQTYPNQGSIDISKDITIKGLGTIKDGNLPYIKELPAQDGSYAEQTLQVLNTLTQVHL